MTDPASLRRFRAHSWRTSVAVLLLPLAACVSNTSDAARSPSSQDQELYDPSAWIEDDSEDVGYFAGRWHEFLDAVSLRLITGPGLGARVRATQLAQAALLYSGPADSFGELLALDTHQFGTSGRSVGMWSVRSVEVGIAPFYLHDQDVHPLGDDPAPWSSRYEDRSATSFEAEVHAGLIGFDASFDPVSFGRFLIGWFGFGEGGWFH